MMIDINTALKPLVGKRLRLRAVEPCDAMAMWEMECDSDQWLLNGMMGPFSIRNMEEYALSYTPDPFREGQMRLLAQLEGPDKNVAGIADLYDVSARNRTAWLGVYVRPEYRRRGFAREMIAVMERYASEILNLRCLGARIARMNHPSVALFESSGYDRAGALSGWIEIKKNTTDLLIYQKEL